MGRKFNILLFVVFLLVFFTFAGCEKQQPVYVLKPEVGENSMVQYDLMKDQPKFLRVRKTEYERARAVEERKRARDKARGIYPKESIWDY